MDCELLKENRVTTFLSSQSLYTTVRKNRTELTQVNPCSIRVGFDDIRGGFPQWFEAALNCHVPFLHWPNSQDQPTDRLGALRIDRLNCRFRYLL